MAKNTPKQKGDLTTLEIKTITDQLAALREKIRGTGATVLSPTAEWDRLRKEIALLNKSLNADASAKREARDITPEADDTGPEPPPLV